MALSTVSSLAVKNDSIVKEDDLLLINGSEQRTAGVVAQADTADTLDVFEDSSCIACYRLNGNADDLSGNYNGTETNMNYGTGKYGQAGLFNGADSYITVPDAAIDFGLTADISISFWVFFNSSATEQNMIGSDNPSAGDSFQIRRKTNNILEWLVYDDAAGMNIIGTEEISQGEWHHVVVVKDGLNTSMYIDNELYGSNTGSQQPAVDCSNYLLGSFYSTGTPSNFLDGLIDQVRVFNKALNLTEIGRLYEEEYKTVAISPDLPAIPTSSKIVSRYDLYEEGSYADLLSNTANVQLGDSLVAYKPGNTGSGYDIDVEQIPSGSITVNWEAE